MTEYLLSRKADLGNCTDVRGYDGRIYVLSKRRGGSLCVLSPALTLLAEYTQIGNVRQIEIRNGIAYITAREDGLWIFDVRKVHPISLAHYRTVEFATGITVCGRHAFVSCRQYGVEIIDISNPQAPQYVGVIRIGEAQSACVYKNVLYGGVWGKMKVVAVDLSDIHHPETIVEIPLSGRGDGVVVRDGILYAAIGQHRRGIKNATDHEDPSFGMGNGFEVFDVHDPHRPKRLHTEFFNKGYCIHTDMWKPMLCGDLLITNNPTAGVLGYDAETFLPKFRISLPIEGESENYVTGSIAYGGNLYITSRNGIFTFNEMPFSDAFRHDAPYLFVSPNTVDRNASFPEIEGSAALTRVYGGAFPVLAAAEGCGFLALACGDGGIHVLSSETKQLLTKSDAFYCCDLRVHGNLVLAASAEHGLRILRFDGTSLTSLSESSVGGSALQLEISKSGRFLAVVCDSSTVKLFDVQDSSAPKVLSTYESQDGPLYGENFLSITSGGGIALFWHRHGMLTVDPDNGEDKFHRTFYPLRNGFTGYCPGNGALIDKEHIFFLRKDGYVLLSPDGSGYVDDLPIYCAAQPIRGKLTLAGKWLIATERAEGVVSISDVSDVTHPVTLATIRTSASPSKAVVTRTGILIPARYGGLFCLTIGL